MKTVFICTLALTISAFLPVSARIINIPDDYLRIQQGIDASYDGDTVLVQPGIYSEEISIAGTFVTLGSLFLTTGDDSYIRSTVIDGNWGAVVRIAHCDFGVSMVVGFRIKEGSVGVYCLQANAIIAHNDFDHIQDIGVFENTFAAGIECESSNITIASNTISGVNAVSFGDEYLAKSHGVYSIDSDLALYNNIIVYTAATSMIQPTAVGFYCENSNSILWNNTIAANGTGDGGGIRSVDSETLLMNDIVWYNFAFQIDGSVTASYCNVSYDVPGEGNINEVPNFRGRTTGDFHLMSVQCGDNRDSPCIDAGHPDMADSLLDCSWGLGGPRSDMGAYGGGDSVYVGIYDRHPVIPTGFIISQNYPNPFNRSTVISYSLQERAHIRIEIFDLLGRKIDTPIHGEQPAGFHSVIWDAGDRPSGVYLYRARAGEHSETRKMVLLK